MCRRYGGKLKSPGQFLELEFGFHFLASQKTSAYRVPSSTERQVVHVSDTSLYTNGFQNANFSLGEQAASRHAVIMGGIG